MQPKTPLTMAVAMCLLLSAAPGHGLGFGRVQAPATLGSPLAFTVPVRLEGGERFDADCVQAEVQAGDRRLPPYELRLAVSPGTRDDERLLQLSTLGAVDEPVISVLITSACSQRVSRRFTVLAQPPAVGPNRLPALMAAEAAAASAAAHPARAAAAASGRSRPPQAAHVPAARVAAAPRTRAAPAHSLRLDTALPLAGGTAAAVALGAGLAAPAAGLAAAGLEAGVPTVVAQAATEVAGDQIKALEQQVQEMLIVARRQQEQLGQMRQSLSAAEAANRWLPWLLLGLVATGALALWLGLRVRRLQREQARLAWLRPGAGAPPVPADDADALSGQAPLLSPDQPLLSRAADLPGATQAVPTQPALTVAHPMVAAVAAATAPPAPPPPPPAPSPSEFSMGTGVPPRPVSVEELLDLDQQADFFMVLGQEQSAIDLLLSHVRSTGGTNALPYFKLLEIYRQQADEEAYERTRERFNQRFNAFAPDWSGDLDGGRTLEAYPEVVERLQRAWPQPLRAVAELESLLLRRADLEPFDLPAYREVLMLHALVRDLPASPVPALAGSRAAAAPGPFAPLATMAPMAAPAVVAVATVDLLLPLDGGDDDDDDSPDITLPRPHLSERSSAQAMLADWVFTRTPSVAAPPAGGLDDDDTDAGVRIDLDLSDFAPAPREFTRPAAFTDVELRRDSRLSDLAAFDDSDLLPPPSRR